MTPIRIASSPPTESGNYLHKGPTTTEGGWVAVTVIMMWGVLRVQHGPVSITVKKMGGQWSTRIPDPVEETDGE